MVRHFSAGGIVYRKLNSQFQFLVCKSSNQFMKDPWCLPKGWLDDASDGIPGPKTLGTSRASTAEVEETALREVREEAGVEARIVQRLGSVQYVFSLADNQKVFKTIIFFLMEYLRDLPEGFGYETSEIVWVDASEACRLLKNRKGECDLIKKALSVIVNQ
ncbi:hypothetical protein A2397_00090 [Candidatus Amesbacteria bacterium RIFOXYB1_FULL_44_23]|uniref:Nudix hydrolase domain-containing protein n=1 Tax=Candidatus Amesbacteria bacterium RIFOXYB1_FULL_44_23 TaxID=1797263 RepID=A0A1F4ZWB7_9BACT|nr:MAG: hypothetical protein A2397_00090 [Candidatus Amesbacteria bacterium RIFOXYB1_FULL_44_23]